MSDATPHRSPIAPGYSWYEATVGDRPEYPKLDGDIKADVCIIGGGFTGLSAAAEAAKLGASVVLIEGSRLGDGASGRNGGQLNTGQRSEAPDHAEALGFERAKPLFDLAEEAKAHLLGFAGENEIDIEYVAGHYSVAHKKSYVADYQRYAEVMAEKFDYPHLTFLDRHELSKRIGSDRYFGGTYDSHTGHIHPLKLIVGAAKVAAIRGAQIFENTRVSGTKKTANGIVVQTASGSVTADRVLLAVNAYGDEKLNAKMASHVMPIQSFIGATPPLEGELDETILPDLASVDDSRFVVRYFRRSREGHMLFGGREAYSSSEPSKFVDGIRRQMTEVYPQLKDIEITHAWGGNVGITLPREPFVRQVQPGITAIGGYSGHGVMLSNFTGKMWAEAVCGNRDRLHLLKELKVPPFPGGRRFRKPLLTLALTWYAMLDRL
ncbi:MAG: FAD-binding oxidoreductase [Pseudomonadota bacterium]